MTLDFGEKTKFIIIGLAVILIISIFVNLQTYSAKKAVERQRNDLENVNTTLAKKIEEVLNERKQLQERVKELNNDLERISQEREGLQKQKEEIQKLYEAIVKERDELKEKLKPLEATAQGEEGVAPTKEEAYWAGVLKSKTDLSLQIENLRTELKTLQMDNEQLRRDLASLTREKTEIEQNLNYNQKTFDNITSQLVLEKSAKFHVQDEVRPLKTENATLRKKLKILSAQKIKIEDDLRQLKEEKSELERRLTEIETFVEDRLSRTKDLELKRQLDMGPSSSQPETVIRPKRESIELPPIVVHPQTEMSPLAPPQTETPSLREEGRQVHLGGSILGINKENNFVVVDLGRNAGIALGDILQVYRENKAIATIEVVQVREGVSACTIKEEIEPIAVGDTIR